MNRRYPAATRIVLLAFLMATTSLVGAQQVADPAFRPPIATPAFPIGKGPVVLIDEAHDNFHTSTGRYLPFAELLRRDGFVVAASTTRFTPDVLKAARVLVTANGVAPPLIEEVTAVRNWVAGGGALFLIADHAPFDALARELGRAFGIQFSSGFARDPKNSSGRLLFRRAAGTLANHAVTKGIDEVATFTGTSFQIDDHGQPLLVFGSDVYLFKEQDDPNPGSLKGHAQGAVIPFGSGRVAVFGEAAMFSAQLTGPDRLPMGMNAPIARDNAQFLMNVMHWLVQ